MVRIGYIYIIKSDENRYKIGISNNPKKRLKQLQTGNQSTLTLIFSEEFNCTRNHLLKIEKEIHQTLNIGYKKLSGEWYLIDETKLQEIINLIKFYRIRFEDDILYFNKIFK